VSAITQLPVARREHLECINRARHAFGNFVERLNDRLTGVGDANVEQYCRGRIALVLDCQVSLPIEFKAGRCIKGEESALWERDVFIVLKADVHKPHHLEHWDKQLVLVSNVQFVQGPQGVIPSRVGLYNIHEKIANETGVRVIGGSLLFQSAIQGSFKILSGIADWKPRVTLSAPCGSLDSLVVEKVERTLEIVDSVTSDESGISSGESCAVNIEKQVIAPFVFLDADGVKIRLSESVQKFIQIKDVLVGPFNLTS